MSQRRREQLASALERAVQEVLVRGLQDPRIKGLITVTGVDLSEDGRDATVRVSILPEEHQELTMHGLRAATRHIQRAAADRIRVRQMPRLAFRLDVSLKRQAGVLDALARARAEFRDPEPEPEGDNASAPQSPPGVSAGDGEPASLAQPSPPANHPDADRHEERP